MSGPQTEKDVGNVPTNRQETTRGRLLNLNPFTVSTLVLVLVRLVSTRKIEIKVH